VLSGAQLEQYLDRIGYRGPTPANVDTLRKLHVAHLLATPFENLDIPRGRPIVLDEARLFDKIVRRHRGGFCYEQNGLFAALLRAIGFRIDMIAAGVFGERGYGPDFDHMALIVHLEEPWLADVGFGDGFREPLRLNERAEQRQDPDTFRIDPEADRFVLLRQSQPQYRFTLQPRGLTDYEEMCRYHQTSPKSFFTQRRMCSLATEWGRITLSDSRLIETRNGLREERDLTEDEVPGVLRDRFGIVLD
jgi:N-hydroxyarylamine O-acetyltransferase